MRKIKFLLAAVCLLAASLVCFAACGHSHTPENGWTADESTHWQRCLSCGRRANEGSHVFDKCVCTVCGYRQLFTVTIDWGELGLGTSNIIAEGGKDFELKVDLLEDYDEENHNGWSSLRAGYDFLGWSKTQGGELLKETKFNVTQDCKFFANWRKTEFTVDFHTQFGAQPQPLKFNVDNKDDVVLPELHDDEMTFLYWSTEPDGDIAVKTLGFENYELYAVWAKIEPFHAETDHLKMDIGDVCPECGYKVAAKGDLAVLMQKDEEFRAEYYGNFARGDFAEYAEKLSEVFIGKNVRTIDNFAFADCTNLKTVTFADGGRLKTVGDYAFFGCTSLEKMDLPLSVTQVNAFAFAYCSSLKNVTLGNADKVNYHTFAGCTSLEELLLPDSVSEIAPYAFSGAAVQKLVLGANVKTVGDHAFLDCTLGEVTFKGGQAQQAALSVGEGNENFKAKFE